MGVAIFWMDVAVEAASAQCKLHAKSQIGEAQQLLEFLRAGGKRHVCISTDSWDWIDGCEIACDVSEEASGTCDSAETAVAAFWIDASLERPVLGCKTFRDGALGEALAYVEMRRKEGMRHLCISTENSHSVGAAGVASVEGGMTPDGHRYEWSKAHRAGATRRGGRR